MEDQLQIISPAELQSIDSKEIDAVISDIVVASRENYQEIEELTLESVSLLTSAQAKSESLASQKTFKRLWNNFTGKNDKLRNSITQDTSAAQYAAQQTINRILAECTQNQRLALAVNDRLNQFVLEFQADHNKVTEDIVRARTMIVALYQDYNHKIETQIKRIAEIESASGEHCPRCYHGLQAEQIICPVCGEIHPLKVKKVPKDIQAQLKMLSEIIQRNQWDTGVYWDDTAKRYAETMLKTREMVKRGRKLSLSESLQSDIDNLIEKCRSAEFQIAMVGVVKAGKSMLMNALIGQDLASTGLNSETAALTKFRSSPNGNYVKVRFYSQNDWAKLNASAQSSVANSESGSKSLRARLSQASVQEAAKKWVGREEPVVVNCDDIDSLRETIRHWTSAQSDEHLFAAEVEVGIDRSIFDMPEEVVFVDTPGLFDPIKYRSQITKDYIGKANAVLLAVKPDVLSVEGISTITTVLDYVGENKKKVYIIGTQKDSLQSSEGYDTLIDGPGGWVEQLVDAGRYKDWKEVRAQILTTSAYLHLCMKKVLSLSTEDLQDVDKFSDDKYNDLENGIKKVLGVRRYVLEDLRSDEETIQRITKAFGVEQLKGRLNADLISRYRLRKIEDIQEDYRRCRAEILKVSKRAAEKQQEKVDAARKGSDALKRKLVEAETSKKALDEEREEVNSAINALRQFATRYMELSRAGGSKRRGN